MYLIINNILSLSILVVYLYFFFLLYIAKNLKLNDFNLEINHNLFYQINPVLGYLYYELLNYTRLVLNGLNNIYLKVSHIYMSYLFKPLVGNTFNVLIRNNLKIILSILLLFCILLVCNFFDLFITSY